MKDKRTSFIVGKSMGVWLVIAALLVPAFTVLQTPLQSMAATVKLNRTSKTIVIGDSFQLSVSGTSQTVKWSVGNKRIASVSANGKVTAKRRGTTTITAKVGLKKYKCKITVITQQKEYISSVLSCTNIERRKYGYASFDQNALLQSAAQKRARELATKFSHTRPNGTHWASAISMQYNFSNAAENIACDYATPKQVVNAWMRRASSKAKIIGRQYNEIGVGVYLGEDGYLYWVTIYGKRK